MPIVRDELEASRRLFLKRRPYFAPFLLRCHLLLIDGDEIFCDRHWRIYIGKDWPLVGSERKSRVPILATGIYHELLHLLQSHFQRGKNLRDIDETAWLLACDCEINDDLISDLLQEKAGGMIFPSDGVWPEKLRLPDGRMAEEYWKALHKRKRSRPAAKGVCCGGGSGVGQPHASELPADDSTYPTPSDLEKSAALRDFANRAAVWHAENTPGTRPGWLNRMIDVGLPAPVPWHRRLEKHLREALTVGGDDYSWARPNRRNPFPDRFAMPGLVAHSGELGILVDTSGSISENDLAEAFGVIKGLLRRICGHGSCVRLLACDTSAKDAGRIHSASKIRLSVLELPRGGGTDLRIGISLAEKLGLRCLLILTDGWTPWPETKPRVPVFVALIGGPSSAVPRWAVSVKVEKV